MRRRALSASLLACALAACDRSAAAGPLPDLELDGFAMPASALHDPVADVYLVANIDGQPTAKDGVAAISRVTPDGRIERQWIAGGNHGVVLNAPKGMAIHGELLWVADIDVVRRFDRRSGAPRGEVAIPGATFLQDVAAAPDGSIWVTDAGLTPEVTPSGTDAIHQITVDGSVRTVARDRALAMPHGIVALAAGAYVVSWATGEFAQVDGQGRRTVLARTPQPQLDGLVRLDGGRWLATSRAGQCLYEFDTTGAVRVHAWPGLEQPADLGCDQQRGRLLVPLLAAGKLLIHRL